MVLKVSVAWTARQQIAEEFQVAFAVEDEQLATGPLGAARGCSFSVILS
jgi:hypothetical protein